VWRDPANPHLIGWAIGSGETYADTEYRDQVEAEALYDLLERDVVPTFYDRSADRVPRKWIERMKASIGSLCPFVNTHRMVSDYFHQFYLDAHRNFRALDRESAASTRTREAWVDRVRREWGGVRIETVEQASGPEHRVGGSLRVEARVQLGGLGIDDVSVELYTGRLDTAREIADGSAVAMQPSGTNTQAGQVFAVDAPCRRAGLYGYTVRIRPRQDHLLIPAIAGLVHWAESASEAPAEAPTPSDAGPTPQSGAHEPALRWE
jgi:starch phosphorylase